MTLIRTIINGSAVVADAINLNTSLLDLLREKLNLKGTKQGCGSGDCGACTVIIEDDRHGANPRAVNACITPAAAIQNKHVITVEGLADRDILHPVQQALIDHHGSQCGFCTPGFVMALTAHSLRADAPKKSARDDIVAAISGNLCRCTGYWPIVKAGMLACPVGEVPRLGHLRSAAPQNAMPESESEAVGDVSVDAAYQIEHDEAQLARSLMAQAAAADPLAPSGSPAPMIIAGATDAWVAVNQELEQHDAIIDISQIHSLKEITANAGVLEIGACVTHSELLDYFTTPPHESSAVKELLNRFGSPQIRNRGTIGGNICGGSPIADWPPVLLALDASVLLKSVAASRVVALRDFFLGYRQTSLIPGEYLAAVQLNIPERWSQISFDKISKRYEDDISSVCAAIYLKHEETVVREARIAFGGVAATPIRLFEIEALLVDQPLAEIDTDMLSDELAGALMPISDVRASADYRAQMAVTLLLNRLSREQATG